MFERFFQWVLRHGPSVLCGTAVVILLVGVGQAIDTVRIEPGTRATTYFGRLWEGLSISWNPGLWHLLRALSTAAWPFFGALVIQRIDLWLQRRETVVAVGSAPAPSWLARRGPTLLFALAVPYVVLALLAFVIWLWRIPSGELRTLVLNDAWTWLSPIWSASLLLFASLALDRLDRWLASVRPYSG
jgi:hypothetical protein